MSITTYFFYYNTIVLLLYLIELTTPIQRSISKEYIFRSFLLILLKLSGNNHIRKRF